MPALNRKRLYFIRHAHTEWNGPPVRIQGQADSNLSSRDRQEATRLGQLLARPDRIVSSPAARCLQTVDCLFQRPADETDRRLLEIDLGWYSGLLTSEIEARDPEGWRTWRTLPAEIRVGGGETLAEVQQRVVQASDEIFDALQSGERVLVVTHGGCLQTLMCHAKSLSLASYHQHTVPNLGLYVLTDHRRFDKIVPEEFV